MNYEIRLEPNHGAFELIDVPGEVARCDHPWVNQTLARVNDSVVRLGIVQGEFHWHQHDDEDELFFVLEGELFVDVEGREPVALGPHQGYLVPKRTRHRTRAPTKTVMLMMASSGVVPTGD